MARIRFIAETDEAGQVVWVWRFGPDDRVAKPVQPPCAHLVALGQADFFGAPEASMKDWLKRHAAGMPVGGAPRP